MKIDKETCAQQFTERDLMNAGKELTVKEYQSIFGRAYRKGQKKPRVFLVTVDDINLFLRDHVRKLEAKRLKKK